MVHVLSPRRQRTREAKTQTYLDAASAIVAAEGIDALTVARVADAVDCAVGTMYRYFPAKDVLVAELQRRSLDVLVADHAAAADALDDALDATPGNVAPRRRALAHAHLVAAHLSSALRRRPDDTRLMLILMGDQRELLSDEATRRTVPAAFGLLHAVRDVFAAARHAGAFADGDDLERSVIAVAATTGLLQTAKLARFDVTLFDPERLAAQALADLYRSWGADPAALADAGRLCADAGVVSAD